jgi:hypothetical protein
MEDLGFLPIIDNVVQLGNQIEASILGQGFKVYRVTELTPPSGVLDGTPVASLFGEFEERAQRKILENQVFELLAFALTIDNRALIKGDLLQQVGYKSDGGVYCFAQYRPPNETIVVRVEGRAIIRRFVDASKPIVDKVPGTWALRTERAQDTEKTADVLTQMDGRFVFAPARNDPFPVVVPIGVQPTTRARPGRNEVPSDVPVERFVGYIPPLGIPLRDNDELEMTDGSDVVYAIEQVYSSGDVGLAGTIALLSKEGT